MAALGSRKLRSVTDFFYVKLKVGKDKEERKRQSIDSFGVSEAVIDHFISTHSLIGVLKFQKQDVKAP